MTTKQLLRTAAVSFAALTMSTASAQFSTFPPLQKPGVEKSASGMHRVSPNLDKESGIMMYASTSGDATMYTSWVSLRANQPSSLTRHFAWIDYTDLDDVYRTQLQPATGAYNPDDGKYYVMMTFVYDCIWNAKVTFNYIPRQWFSIDLANGATEPVEIADLTNWSKEKGWMSYSIDPNAPHWGLWTDMSFDPVDQTMYALAQSEEPITDENPYHSAILQVQLRDGSYRVKKELTGRYYLGMTYDLDGKLYAARWTTDARNQINGSLIVELDRDSFEEKREVAQLTKDEMPFKLCFNGTLDVDRATGELYFVGADFDSGRQYMFKINPKTGTSNYISSFSYDNIVGLHIPYVGTENRNAPARVSNLHTEAAENGANSVTVKWTNPTTQWNLEDLTSLTGVKIYRDNMNGEPIANITSNLTIGGEASYVDNTESGLHTYYVIPYNENGDGVSDSIAAFVGKDTPDAPRDLTAQAQAASMVYLSWQAPTTGLHNGWFDKSNITYTITRSDGVVVAENITDNWFTDTQFEDAPMTLFTYTVTSSNVDGEGGSAVSEPVLAGSDYPIPYTFDFSTESDRAAFSSYSTAYTNWSNDPHAKAWSMYTYDNDPQVDAYLCTPLFNIKAGHTYRVTWNLKFDMAGSTYHTYELTAGASSSEQTSYAQDSFDESLTGSYTQETVSTSEYTAEADGKYMFGLHLTTEHPKYEQILITGVTVEEVLGNDVAANSLSGFPRILKGKEQGYMVNVHNSGRNEQNNFKVQTGYQNRRGEFIVLGENLQTEALPGGEKRDITVPTKADFENGTIVDLCARVVVEGDESEANDVCPAIPVMVEDIEGADAFNAEFIGNILSSGEGYGETNVPFTTYDPNTTSVTIYPRSLLATAGKEPYEISRIGFTSFNTIGISECDVKVYMGTTDEETFNYPIDNVISPSDLTLVHEGVTTPMLKGFDGTSIQLNEPFIYDGTSNLVVALEVTCHSGIGDWCIYWNTWDREVGKYHSLRTNNPTWDPKNVARGDGMPDLHMAVKALGTPDSVETINAEAAFSMLLNGRTLWLNGNVKSLNVYDLAGRLINSQDVTGRSSVSLNVPDGIYLIKAADANGNARTLKAAIR